MSTLGPDLISMVSCYEINIDNILLNNYHIDKIYAIKLYGRSAGMQQQIYVGVQVG